MIRPQDLTNRIVNEEPVPVVVPEPEIVGLEHEEQRHDPIEESGDEPRQPDDVPPPSDDEQPHDDTAS